MMNANHFGASLDISTRPDVDGSKRSESEGNRVIGMSVNEGGDGEAI